MEGGGDLDLAIAITLTTRSRLSARLMRASSLLPACLAPFASSATFPMPGISTPEPDIDPVTSSALANGISATCREPATDFSTKAVQRAPCPSSPETMLVMS
jgi:hypothetical protein